MRCPYCDSERVELVSPWGGQIITSQLRCLGCGTYFEAVREDFEAHKQGQDGGQRECTTS
jgi:uncharacterized Zn finger protein